MSCYGPTGLPYCTGQFQCIETNGLDWCTYYETSAGCHGLIGGCPGQCGGAVGCGAGGCCEVQMLTGDEGVSQGTCVDPSSCVDSD
jgi:hypothetical protein